MASVTFDTLHAAKALTQAGFAVLQAEAITDTIRDAFTESVATKADMAELEQALKADMAELEQALKADMAELEQALKADMAELEQALKADMAKLEQALKADMAELETRVTTDIAGLKTDMASLEVRLAERFEALYKQLWLVALGMVTAITALVKLL